MGLLQFVGLAFGGAALLAALSAAIALVVAPRFKTRNAAFLLSVACLVGGLWTASFATPDWNPITMALFYLPFLVIGVYAAFVSAYRSRQAARARAEH